MSRVHHLIITAIVALTVVAGGIALSRTVSPEPAAAGSAPPAGAAAATDRTERLARAEAALARLQAAGQSTRPAAAASLSPVVSDDDADRDDDEWEDEWEGDDDD